ncbi:hypothetical protein [Methylophaga sp.]|uniref:hypothetical protein n=1 Tax=Methylophaga sp. TaxID=2024840 RepID=UPI0025D7091B|nr:hypothetical protein [Methylophaga sp.]
MKLHRDILIQAIIKHQKVFFRLLDHIDKSDGALEVPESLYIRDYNSFICNDGDENVQHHLSIESLVDNGVFIHNKGAGLITMERVIVDLLRFIDVKRAKELTHSNFESMRAQVVQVVGAIEIESLGTQTFIDEVNNFNNIMSDIHSKIKENVNTLTAQVEAIAREYKEYDSGSSQINVVTFYDKVSQLYSRFVLPCYEFIDPEMDMVQTQSFSSSVQGLINHFSDESRDVELANKIQLRKTAITSYYKDIAELAEKLLRFTSRLEADRNTYLAIDSAYSHLMESVELLRHGKRKNIYLNSTSEVFQHHSVLDGLTNQKSKFRSKLKWDSEKIPVRFSEYLSLIADVDVLPQKTKNIKPLPPKERPGLKKQIQISKVVISAELPKQIADVHGYLHELLRPEIEAYSVSDMLFALEVFLPKYKANTYRFKPDTKKRLSDESYFIDYMQLNYAEDRSHV